MIGYDTNMFMLKVIFENFSNMSVCGNAQRKTFLLYNGLFLFIFCFINFLKLRNFDQLVII